MFASTDSRVLHHVMRSHSPRLRRGKIMGKGNNSQKNDKKNKKPKKDAKAAAKPAGGK